MLVIKKEQFVYAFEPDMKPVATVKPGELIKFITDDCYGSQIQKKTDVCGGIDWEHTNPATGPVYIEGAEPGDAVAVDILDIRTADQGVTIPLDDCGPFGDRTENRTYILKLKDGKVYWEEKGMVWPYKTMIGVIGLAADKKIPTGWVGNHGGNMDSNIITKGVTLWCPVRVKGGLLAMGDLHASMADGEMCGNGIEVCGEVIVRVRLLKNFKLNWTVTETEDAWYVNTCGATCDEAIREGYIEMHRLLMDAYDMDLTEANTYMSIQGMLAANQACLVSEAGGDSFRTGTPKVLNMPPLIGKREK